MAKINKVNKAGKPELPARLFNDFQMVNMGFKIISQGNSPAPTCYEIELPDSTTGSKLLLVGDQTGEFILEEHYTEKRQHLTVPECEVDVDCVESVMLARVATLTQLISLLTGLGVTIPSGAPIL